MTPSPLLEAQRLSVSLEGHPVVHEVEVSLAAGDTIALVGPNAAGKSTLLRALTGLLVPSEGAVLLRGRALASWGRGAVARSVALVTAEDEGHDSLRVVDRVALGRYPHLGPFRAPRPRDREAVESALDLAGIAHLATRPLGTLSAGERQLASLARGLAQEAEVLLLDEPASHLDVGHELRLFSILDEVARSGVAILAVVHDLQRAGAWASRIVLLEKGRVACIGSPRDVLSSDACARAFSVRIRSHAVPGLPDVLYSFEEMDKEPRRN
jgi:iron complex transport system ATP-binding protein